MFYPNYWELQQVAVGLKGDPLIYLLNLKTCEGVNAGLFFFSWKLLYTDLLFCIAPPFETFEIFNKHKLWESQRENLNVLRFEIKTCGLYVPTIKKGIL